MVNVVNRAVLEDKTRFGPIKKIYSFWGEDWKEIGKKRYISKIAKMEPLLSHTSTTKFDYDKQKNFNFIFIFPFLE